MPRLVLIVELWLRDDDVAGFEALERRFAVRLAVHGGVIERAVRLDGALEGPFEIHVVSFPDEAAFAAYRVDAEVAALAAERERVIARTVIRRGHPVTY
jgi:hypothetical protein